MPMKRESIWTEAALDEERYAVLVFMRIIPYTVAETQSMSRSVSDFLR